MNNEYENNMRFLPILKFFDKYKKDNPVGRKSGENLRLYESKYDLHRQNNATIKNVFKNYLLSFDYLTCLIM